MPPLKYNLILKGGRKMIGVAMYVTIKSLWEKHKNKPLITRLSGHNWKTVSQKIKEIEAGKKYPKKKPHPRMLDSHKGQILEWLEEDLSRGSKDTRKDARKRGKDRILCG